MRARRQNARPAPRREMLPRETLAMMEALRAEGKQLPNLKLIKTPAQIEGIRRAGDVNTRVLDAVEREIAPGMTTEDIDRIVARETKALGGRCAPLGFEGFPKSVCTSTNDVVCHGIPSEKTVLRAGDIVNVDCTTEYGGYYGDASRMFCIGDVSDEARRLVEVTRQSVNEALAHLAPYTATLGDIGYYINTYVTQFGYSVVRTIGGHGVGLAMHEDPYVCHVGRKGHGMTLVPGMVFTIEPMVNAGREEYDVRGKEAWEVYTRDGSLSAQWEHTVLITETGYEILSY